MKKEEYMARLSELLADMPENEKKDALEYYENYFNEARERQEEELIKTLGSPEKLADMVREGIREEEPDDHGEYTDSGYRDERYKEESSVPQMYCDTEKEADEEMGEKDVKEEKDCNLSRNTILLIIVGVVFFFNLRFFRIPGLIVLAAVLLFMRYHKGKNLIEKSDE